MSFFCGRHKWMAPLCVCVCVCVCVFVTSIHGLYCAYYAMTWNLFNINCLNCVSHPGVELCLIGYPWPVYMLNLSQTLFLSLCQFCLISKTSHSIISKIQ